MYFWYYEYANDNWCITRQLVYYIAFMHILQSGRSVISVMRGYFPSYLNNSRCVVKPVNDRTWCSSCLTLDHRVLPWLDTDHRIGIVSVKEQPLTRDECGQAERTENSCCKRMTLKPHLTDR